MAEALEERLAACVAMLERTGAKSFEIRYSEPDSDANMQAVAWMAMAEYSDEQWDVAAGRTPLHASERLLDQLLDGGLCRHCDRPTGVSHDLDPLPLSDAVCWYQYDPELKTYRRGCEGDTQPSRAARRRADRRRNG